MYIARKMSARQEAIEVTQPIVNHSRLRDSRILLGFSQEELARIIGCSTRSVQGWEAENGTQRPRGKHIRRLAELAEKPVAWFFESDDQQVAA